MNHFFLNHEMFVAGSTYWNMAYGQMPGDVHQDEEGMNNMRNLGQNLAFLLRALNGCLPLKDVAEQILCGRQLFRLVALFDRGGYAMNYVNESKFIAWYRGTSRRIGDTAAHGECRR